MFGGEGTQPSSTASSHHRENNREDRPTLVISSDSTPRQKAAGWWPAWPWRLALHIWVSFCISRTPVQAKAHSQLGLCLEKPGNGAPWPTAFCKEKLIQESRLRFEIIFLASHQGPQGSQFPVGDLLTPEETPQTPSPPAAHF